MTLFRKKETKARCQTAPGTIGSIKVLGSGCRSCHALLQSTEAAVQSIGLPLEVEYITDVRRIAEYGIMSTPALMVNEQVVSAGRVLSAEKAEQLLRSLL